MTNSSAQVSKTEYNFKKYGGLERFASYAHQITEILAVDPEKVLEVGVGDGVTSSYIKNQHKNINYVVLDIAEDLNPDLIGDVRDLPFDDASFDVACAFEVLEHIPFDDFTVALNELARVSKRYILISLPHYGPPIKFSLKLPFFKEWQFALKVPVFSKHEFNGQHYWEIGKYSYPLGRIKKILTQFGCIEKEFVPFDNQYHHFFVVRLKK